MTELAHAYAIALNGLQGVPVDVQTHVGPGIVGTTLVGLPDASLREAKDRVRAALFSCGIAPANKRVTINLSPADLRKTGSGFDLAIAVSILIARGVLPSSSSEGTVFVAELGLDGKLLEVPGTLPAAGAAYDTGFARIVVSAANEAEARLVEGIKVVPCAHLEDLLIAFGGTGESVGGPAASWEAVESLTRLRIARESSASSSPVDFESVGEHDQPGTRRVGGEGDQWADLADVLGQPAAVDALVVAAAGGHHALFHGPPGVGKSMLCKRIRGILPELERADALTATAIRSLAYGANSPDRVVELSTRPPLEAPHHSATTASLIGGGWPIRPGAISLAHAGVLLLDEAPEFLGRTLDSLRQPLETHEIRIDRARSQVTFPARFQLLMTANPCGCGGSGNPKSDSCRCSPIRVSQYRSRLSGPLLDRVDLQIHMSKAHRSAMSMPPNTTTAAARDQVRSARERGTRRWCDTPWSTNAEIPGKFIRQSEKLPREYLRMLERSMESGRLSFRGADRVLRLAWTCADLEGHAVPTSEDFLCAMELRGTMDGTHSWMK